MSVVVPCYRYGQHLPACVASVLDQPGVDVRVLVIDDASPDDSGDVAAALAIGDSRIEVVRHVHNLGHLATYNEGLAWANREFTVLLSADDLLVPGALARATTLLRAHPRVGFVYGRSVYFQDVLPALRTGPGRGHVWSGRRWLRRRFREATNVISSPEVVMRTSVLQAVGGFREGLDHAGDLDLWLRLAAVSDVGHVRGADQALYRRHADSMSSATYGGALVDLRQRLGVFEALHDDPHVPLPDRERLHRQATTALARQALWRASRAYDRGRTRDVPVAELVAFAERACPRAHRLRAWAGLAARRRIGAARMPYLQPLVLTAVVHRLRTQWWWLSWRYRGI